MEPFFLEPKSDFKFEGNNDLTFIVIIINIDWYKKIIVIIFWAISPSPTYNRTAMHFMDDHFLNLGEEVILTLRLGVFGQSQCTGPVSQSEQTACRKTKRLREAGHRGPTITYSIWKILCFWSIKACQHILLHQIHKIMIFKKSIIWPL